MNLPLFLLQSWRPNSGPHRTPQQCACRVFQYDKYGDHLQTCQIQSAALPSLDWVVYKLGALLGCVGHTVKIHKITPATRKERGDIELRDYVVLQSPKDRMVVFLLLVL